MVKIVVRNAADCSIDRSSVANSFIINENNHYFGMCDEGKSDTESAGKGCSESITKHCRLRRLSRILLDLTVANISGESSQVIVETSIVSNGLVLTEQK